MTKTTISLFSLAIMLIFACNTSDAPTSSDSLAPTSAPSSTQKEKPRSLKDLTEKEEHGMKILKPRREAAKGALSVKEKNMTSPYKYLTTSDEYPIFTYLMSRSILTKHIHNAGVTVLAPVDKAFDDYPNYKELLLPINQEELDNFIAYHIIDTPLSYKAFSLGDSWSVHAGLILSITRGEGVNFNGAQVRSGSVETDLGVIIGMDNLVFYPQLSH